MILVEWDSRISLFRELCPSRCGITECFANTGESCGKQNNKNNDNKLLTNLTSMEGNTKNLLFILLLIFVIFFLFKDKIRKLL